MAEGAWVALSRSRAGSGTTDTLNGSQWQYNWKTPSRDIGHYWRIGVQLDDGQTYYVNIALS